MKLVKLVAVKYADTGIFWEHHYGYRLHICDVSVPGLNQIIWARIFGPERDIE